MENLCAMLIIFVDERFSPLPTFPFHVRDLFRGVSTTKKAIVKSIFLLSKSFESEFKQSNRKIPEYFWWQSLRLKGSKIFYHPSTEVAAISTFRSILSNELFYFFPTCYGLLLFQRAAHSTWRKIQHQIDEHAFGKKHKNNWIKRVPVAIASSSWQIRTTVSEKRRQGGYSSGNVSPEGWRRWNGNWGAGGWRTAQAIARQNYGSMRRFFFWKEVNEIN